MGNYDDTRILLKQIETSPFERSKGKSYLKLSHRLQKLFDLELFESNYRNVHTFPTINVSQMCTRVTDFHKDSLPTPEDIIPYHR